MTAAQQQQYQSKFWVNTKVNQQQQQGENTVYRPPNPMDPFDDVKRWLRELWPLQRWLVYAACAAVIWLALLWVTWLPRF